MYSCCIKQLSNSKLSSSIISKLLTYEILNTHTLNTMQNAEKKIFFCWDSQKYSYRLQYSPFITSHTRGIYSVAPCNFSHGKTKNYVWHGELPRVEKGFSTPRNCHAWRWKPMPLVANIKTTVTHIEETHYTHCFEIYLYCILNWQFVFTGIADAPYQLCLLWIGS